MNSTSPPTPVTARPVATPGTATRSAASKKNFWPAQVVADALGRDHDDSASPPVPRRDLGRHLAQHLADLALQVPDAGLARVVADDDADRVVGQRHLLGRQPVALELPRQQVVARDRDLLVLGVAVQPDDLHAVEQRSGDRLAHVPGRDEQHLGQVEVDVQVVVAERVVLRRVEDLEQRAATGRPASRRRPCRSRRASSPGSSCRRPSTRGRCGPAARRRTCAGARGSRPRRARRPATRGRTCGPAPARRSHPARSCRRPAGRPGSGSRPTRGRRSSRSARARRAACGRPGTR